MEWEDLKISNVNKGRVKAVMKGLGSDLFDKDLIKGEEGMERAIGFVKSLKYRSSNNAITKGTIKLYLSSLNSALIAVKEEHSCYTKKISELLNNNDSASSESEDSITVDRLEEMLKAFMKSKVRHLAVLSAMIYHECPNIPLSKLIKSKIGIDDGETSYLDIETCKFRLRRPGKLDVVFQMPIDFVEYMQDTHSTIWFFDNSEIYEQSITSCFRRNTGLNVQTAKSLWSH